MRVPLTLPFVGHENRSLGVAVRLALLTVATLVAAGAAFGAVVLDRIAVLVNDHVIKTSDIDRDIRLTDFLNNDALSETAADKKKAAERLIDQQVIRSEVATGQYGRPPASDADALLGQIRKERFGGSDVRLKQGLERYGLTEDQLRNQLLWQLTVLRFINERFRAGVIVSDDDVRKYYDQHRSSYRGSFEASEKAIRTNLEGEQVTKQFEAWLDEARKMASIEYRERALS